MVILLQNTHFQENSNLLRRRYRLLSKGTIEEEAGRISRKSQLQKHGQARQACCISITLHNIAAETAAWKPRRWVGLNVTKTSRVAGKFERAFRLQRAVGLNGHCQKNRARLGAFSTIVFVNRPKLRLGCRSIKANYWPANSVNCEGGLFAHCAQYRSPLC